MLKKIKQISLFLAGMIILLHAVIPHHHHPNKPVCINHIEHNDCDNHKDHNHDFDESNCIIDDYFTPKDNNEFKTYVRMSPQDISFCFDFIHNNIMSDFLLKDKGKEFRRNKHTFIYKDPLASFNIGLRAPPPHTPFFNL